MPLPQMSHIKFTTWLLMWLIWRYGNGIELLMERWQDITNVSESSWCSWKMLTVYRGIPHNVSWLLANRNRSCTDRFKLPLLSHASQTFIMSYFRTLQWRIIIIIIHIQFLTHRNMTKSLQGRASTQWLMTCLTKIVVSRLISVRSCQWWRGKTSTRL